MKIKLTARQKMLRRTCTREVKWGHESRNRYVELAIGNQGFRIADDCTKTEANWWRDMLAKALSKIPQ